MSDLPKTVTVRDLRGCSRCGGDHRDITFRLLERPIPGDERALSYTHWAPCPTNGDPILMAERPTAFIWPEQEGAEHDVVHHLRGGPNAS